MKFLIIRFSSIGDIVLTTPVIRCLRQKFPEAEIHYLTKKSFLPVLINNPYLTSVHTIEKDIDGVIDELKKIQFDLINTSASGLAFTLNGPNGYVAFTDLANDSSLVLPCSRACMVAAANCPISWHVIEPMS